MIERFLEVKGMPTWASPTCAWGDRGVWLAAKNIAWAMTDQPIQLNPKVRGRPCNELARYYELLTGRPPEPTPPG